MVDKRNSGELASLCQELQKHWMNEKLCKDLLTINEPLIDKITSLIDEKEEEIKVKAASKKETDLEVQELDIERVKFLLKDYFRIRLKKVDRYLFFIVKNEQTNLLSKSEFDFTLELYKLKKNFLNEYFYRKVPAKFNDFHMANTNNDHVIVEPDDSDYLAFKANIDLTFNLNEIHNEYSEFITIKKNDIAFLPMKLLREKLKNNQISLL